MSAAQTSFYVTGGTLRSDAPSYVERQADKELFDGLLRGEFCYVLTSRQMGKSSLMVRTAKKLREQGVAVAVLDLTAIGQNLTVEQWYHGLLAQTGKQLGLEDELDQFWFAQGEFGPLQRWMSTLAEVVLRRHTGQVVIFVDEIDIVRSLAFSTDEFFAAIRACYNQRAEKPDFNRLTFCLLGVAAPTDLIRDTRLTPFNIGRRMELNDFTDESWVLAKGLSSNEQIGLRLLQRVLHWTNGHPYLTQRLCRAVAEDQNASSPADVDRHCQELFLSARARERDDNLIFVRERLLNSEADRAALLDIYAQVCKGKRVPDDEKNLLVSILRLAGIVRGGDGVLRVRNRIYERVFDWNWIVSNLPDAEVRRQRVAFRRGLVRATALSFAGLVLLLGLLTFQRPLNQVQTLPDGSTLTLRAVTYGKQHHFEPGYLRLSWVRDLLRLPPGAFDSVIKPSRYRPTSSDALVFWTVHNQPGSLPATRWVAVDEQDHEIQAGTRGSGLNSAVVGPEIQDFELPFFPRRGQRVGLRIYQFNTNRTWVRVAEFTVPNPKPGPHPLWTPERLPIRRKVDGLEIALTNLTVGVIPGTVAITDIQGNVIDGVAVTDEGFVPSTHLQFYVTQDGQPAKGWQPREIILSDATGNNWKPDFTWGTVGEQGIWFSNTLLPQETVKLSVGFAGGVVAAFAHDEAVLFRGLPLPGPGQVIETNVTAILQGVTVELLAIVGANAPQTGRFYSADLENPTIHVRVAPFPLKEGLRFDLVQTSDEKGREIRSYPKRFWGNGRQSYSLEIPDDATAVNATFVVQKLRYAEFLVNSTLTPKTGEIRRPD